MDKVFTVETRGKRDVWLEVNLPVTSYGMLDLLDKEGLTPTEIPMGQICDSKVSRTLKQVLGNDCYSLYELNALAGKLAAMRDTQLVALDGLVKMENEKMEGPIPLGKLIDLSHSVDCCHVVPEVSNDDQLGRFYTENGFLPETEGLPEALFEILDYEFLGRRARVNEGGVFTDGGYVMRDGNLKEVFASLDLNPHKPEYAILLKVAQGDHAAQLPLPNSPKAMDAVLDIIGAKDWACVSLRCLDCRVPALIPAIGEGDNIAHVNRLAGILESMDDKRLTKFKAVLDATEDYSVLGAAHIATTLDDYLFTPQYLTAEDMARDYIRTSMGEPSASELFPFVQLTQYGQALMKDQECALTDYGMVSREDGQCLKTSLSPTGPIQGGMEMM